MGGNPTMKTPATPTDNASRDELEIYARTNGDGQPEIVFYNTEDADQWINATQSSTVELEEYR
jgi:hypothetical protein